MKASNASFAGKAVVLAALGALATAALTFTWTWALPLLALAALVLAAHGESALRAGCLAWCFSSAWMAASVWWLFTSMHHYGGLPAPVAAVAVALLSGALGLFYALAGAAYAWLARPRPHIEAGPGASTAGSKRAAHHGWRAGAASLAFAALWALADLARGLLFSGFPWGALGYAVLDSPLASLAPWLGVYGMGLGAGFVSAALALVVLGRVGAWLPAACAALGLLVLALLGPAQFTRAAGELSVSLVQTNVPQDQKFADEQMPSILNKLAVALKASRTQLVVAPETAVPLLPAMLDKQVPGYREALREHFAKAQTGAALVGIPLGDLERGFSNSVIGLSASDAPYRYDKHHLVPFGEFVPWGFRWFVNLMNIPLGDFERGALGQPSFPVAGLRVAPNICYEDLFGEELALVFAKAENAPHVLANLSNIAWFGHSVAVPQHLNISRTRAMEFQRPMLRATNTGATAIINHQGRVEQQLAPFTEGVLVGKVQGREGLTPYARWVAAFGLWPLVGLCVLSAVFASLVLRRKA